MRILIVDDDFVSRKVISRMVGHLGACDGAAHGGEALEALRLAWDTGQPYHLVFLDIMMPEIDGRQVLQTLREEERRRGVQPGNEVKVIMVTALDDMKTISTSFFEGASGYVVKPITTEGMHAALETAGIPGGLQR